MRRRERIRQENVPRAEPRDRLCPERRLRRHEAHPQPHTPEAHAKEWVLKCETPKNTSREIALRGRYYPYVVQSADGFERTNFVEVEV